jgi:uncharacterized protein
VNLGLASAIKASIWIFAILAGVYLLLLAGIMWTQRSLLYFPMRETMSPAEAGFAKAQALSLQTPDGEKLVAWYVPAANGKPLFLYFQGNAGGLSDRLERFTTMTADGHGLLAVSYRSYFGSTGTPTEAGLHIDADTAYAEAIRLGYTPDRIVAVGESLGTGVAVALAAQKPVAALILDSPFTSALDVAALTYWMFPTRLLMLDQYHSDQLIGSIHVPVLIVHGTQDGIIPLQFAKTLFALANEPKEFIAVPGAGHLVLARPDVLPRVLHWLDKQLQPQPLSANSP